MSRLRAFFRSMYGVIFFAVVILAFACIVIVPALPALLHFQISADRPTATHSAAVATQLTPTGTPSAMPPSPSATSPQTPTRPPATATSQPTATPTPAGTSTLRPMPTSAPTPSPATPTAAPAGDVRAPAGIDAHAQKVGLLELVNQLRVANGCQPLGLESRLQQAAQAHAEDMRNHRKLDHIGSDGATYGDRLARVGYPFQRYGENITNFFATPRDVMQQWTEGPENPDGPHRKNILNCTYAEAGIGLAYRDDGVPYWVLDLASRTA